MIDPNKVALYAELYQVYRISLPRKTEEDIRAMKILSRLMDLEGISIIQLRKAAYDHFNQNSKPLRIQNHDD